MTLLKTKYRFFCLSALILVLTIVTGCSQGTPRSKDFLLARIDNSKIECKKKLEEYFSKPHSKIFVMDPYSDSCSYSYDHKDKQKALKYWSKTHWMIPFAIGAEYVYEEYLIKYENTPIGNGRKFFKDEKYEAAIEQYKLAEKEDDNSWYVKNQLGWAFMHLKKYTDAIDCFSKSIKEEELSGSFGGRGESYYFLGAYYKALEDFEKAKKLNKGEGYTYWLAMTNLALRDYSKAVNIFGKNPHLGVSISNHESGIRINQVRKNGPAMHAGLQENDIILTMNGIKHKDVSGFITQVSGFAYGSEVPFIIERDGLKYKGTFWAGLASDLEKKYENLPKLVLIDSNPEKVVATKDKPEKTTEKPEIITEKPVRLKASFGEYYALVIGNNNYKYIPKLKTAINDAKSIADLLKNKYGFNVQLVTDAGRSDVLAALNNYRKSLTKNDNLFIFYAGHGWLDQQADRGYWLPVDAEQDSNINWISNASITDAIRAIQAKHIMLVADSCYSGKLTRGINLTSRDPGYIEKLINKKSRTVLTSGGLEPVDDSGGGDHSVFTNSFLNVLTENEDVLDGHLLFSRIRRPILLNSDQTPEYSDIRKVGHDGGDFLFIPKNMK